MDRKPEQVTHLPAPSTHPGADHSRRTGEAGRTQKTGEEKLGTPQPSFPVPPSCYAGYGRRCSPCRPYFRLS